MGSQRWRIELVEESEGLPVSWRPSGRTEKSHPAPSEIAKMAVVAAFELLTRRGTGPLAWAAFCRQDPIAFLLDTMSDAVNLRAAEGTLLYQNRAAERLGLGRSEETAQEILTNGDRQLDRRCCRFRCGNIEYVLEIIGDGAEPLVACLGSSE
jgi:hypothetical protein